MISLALSYHANLTLKLVFVLYRITIMKEVSLEALLRHFNIIIKLLKFPQQEL
jgi:hypothetical protein